MSSVLLGERRQSTMRMSRVRDRYPVALSASHRFRRESTLRFLIFTYNAALSSVDQET